ncbi:fumarate reductase flavoprotein subunit [hydrocarbon metagenome]|uniref:Fumarate reductase flavoprotein subunit n=1 Tax=hydrocarbon metagenome TaxID=938273 RepID=A0A0W8E5P4_9ZZZZ
MKEEKNQPNGISRWKLIQGAAIGTVGIASAGFLTGCSSEGANQDASEPKTKQTANWTTPPEPNPDSKIKKTIETDIVVVGPGRGGMVAAFSAAEVGAKTVRPRVCGSDGAGRQFFIRPIW